MNIENLTHSDPFGYPGYVPGGIEITDGVFLKKNGRKRTLGWKVRLPGNRFRMHDALGKSLGEADTSEKADALLYSKVRLTRDDAPVERKPEQILKRRRRAA